MDQWLLLLVVQLAMTFGTSLAIVGRIHQSSRYRPGTTKTSAGIAAIVLSFFLWWIIMPFVLLATAGKVVAWLGVSDEHR